MTFKPLKRYLVSFPPIKPNVVIMKNEKGENVEIEIDKDFNQYHYSIQVATIVAVPSMKPQEYDVQDEPKYRFDTPLKVGDTVIVHHHVNDKSNRCQFVEEECYWTDYNEIWGIAEGNTIKPLEQWLFLIPIEYKSKGAIELLNFEAETQNRTRGEEITRIKRQIESYYKRWGNKINMYRQEIAQLEKELDLLTKENVTTPKLVQYKYEKQKGILKYFNPYYDYCLKKGMELWLAPKCDYWITINGEELYRVHYSTVYGNR